MPQRKCTKTKAEVTSPIKWITLPITMEKYRAIVADRHAYRQWLDDMIGQHLELFSQAITNGHTLHDDRTSRKLAEVRLRRIRLKACDAEGRKQVFTITPSGVMLYRLGYTVEKALFLRRLDVPFWALSDGFGYA